MALEFVDELPARTRAGGSRIMTDEVVAELKKNKKKWARVMTGVRSGQSVAKFVKDNDGFQYTTRNTGKTDKEGKALYDVFVKYDPSA